MDIPLASSTPAKLYAFLLKLRPLQEGTLMPFVGELVHAAWLDWLRTAAPDVATWLHDGNKRRLFTCSNLQFPFPTARMIDAERNNTHMPLTPEKTCTIRITLLLGELFPLFYQALTDFKLTGSTGSSKPPFMRLGKQSLLLEEVVLDNDDATGWTGFTSFGEMVEKIQANKLSAGERTWRPQGSPLHVNPAARNGESLKLEFASITTFNRGSAKNREYGNYFARLPLPQYVFPHLAKRWQELAPPELAHLVQRERIEQYALDEGIIIADYDLKPHTVKFTTHWQPGFIGTCKYQMHGPDEPTTEEFPLTLRQQLLLLGQLAFYCGVGYKTAMGMGRVRMVKNS